MAEGPQAARSGVAIGPRPGRSGERESCYLLGPALPRGAFLLSRLISALSRYSPGGRPLMVSDESVDEDEPEQPPTRIRPRLRMANTSECRTRADTTR